MQVPRGFLSDRLVYMSIVPPVEGDMRCKAFIVLRHEIKEVVVKTDEDDRIVKLLVISPEEYQEYLSLQDHFTGGIKWRDHWVDLVDGEYITSVEMKHHATHVHSLSFKTNYRTTPWLGKKTCSGRS
ncbi:hypothetical protein Poli38472_006669 [Pythium oligandrum]|uniref:Jacalin-type lectin domain-containing protein n=1 Tax=Pythium oligandrum TaxID=41045 RepID=A0A8K1C566_PYTOL|nr:hypothetical protein Poli38472_006669 [Pythium oligandrum]|eukprot:TMW56659.1 hypothetical protein Poli38472_006669 [Pythium oligandrum]